MELVEGQSLQEEIQTARREQAATMAKSSQSLNKRERIRKLVSLFIGIADALEHVHRQGIVHRDIKPLNLLVNADSTRLFLTDFGLARDEHASMLTRRGDFLGTIRYMSPEQLLAHRVDVDHRSDIYSLAVSFYEAPTLDLPYAAPSDEAYMSAVSSKDPVPARKRDQILPRDVETILMKCLERDRDRRYASAGELRDDLQRWLDDRPIEARRPSLAMQAVYLARKRAAAVIAVSVVIVVALAVGWREMRQRSAERAHEIDEIRRTLDLAGEQGMLPGALNQNWLLLAQLPPPLIR